MNLRSGNISLHGNTSLITLLSRKSFSLTWRSLNCDITEYKNSSRGRGENKPQKRSNRIKIAREIRLPEIFAPRRNLRVREIKRREEEEKNKCAKENAFTRTFAYYLLYRYPSAGYHKPFPDGRVSTHAGEKSRSDPLLPVSFRVSFLSVVALLRKCRRTRSSREDFEKWKAKARVQRKMTAHVHK